MQIQHKTSLNPRCSGGNEMQAATFFTPGFNILVLLDAFVTIQVDWKEPVAIHEKLGKVRR